MERRFTEFRQDGRRLIGTVVRYGDVARMPWGTERFEPGAFQPLGDVILNAHHERSRPLARVGGGLTLEDSPQALTMMAELPNTREADDVLELVKTKVLRGFSVEFHAIDERMEGTERVVSKARLGNFAVVDRPAYPGSAVEARANGTGKRWASGGLPADTRAFCECLTGDCDSIMVQPGAYTMGDDVLAMIGRTTEAVGSVEGGTLRFLDDTKGGLNWQLTDAAKATAAGEIMQDLNAAGVAVYGRPIIDEALSTFTETGTLRTFSRAWIRALLLKPILNDAARAGWEPIKFAGAEARSQRRALWL